MIKLLYFAALLGAATGLPHYWGWRRSGSTGWRLGRVDTATSIVNNNFSVVFNTTETAWEPLPLTQFNYPDTSAVTVFQNTYPLPQPNASTLFVVSDLVKGQIVSGAPIAGLSLLNFMPKDPTNKFFSMVIDRDHPTFAEYHPPNEIRTLAPLNELPKDWNARVMARNFNSDTHHWWTTSSTVSLLVRTYQLDIYNRQGKRVATPQLPRRVGGKMDVMALFHDYPRNRTLAITRVLNDRQVELHIITDVSGKEVQLQRFSTWGRRFLDLGTVPYLSRGNDGADQNTLYIYTKGFSTVDYIDSVDLVTGSVLSNWDSAKKSVFMSFKAPIAAAAF